MTTSLTRGQRISYLGALGRIRWKLTGQMNEVILDSDPDPLRLHDSVLTAAEEDEVPKYEAYALP